MSYVVFCVTNYHRLFKITVTFDNSTQDYQYTNSIFFSHNMQILKMFVVNGIFFMQENSMSIYGYLVKEN